MKWKAKQKDYEEKVKIKENEAYTIMNNYYKK
jgi:hypothetical protein